MKMKRGFATMKDVPEALKDLYVEKDGKAVLDGVEGMDVHNLSGKITEQAKEIETLKKTSQEANEAKTKIEGDLKAAVELAGEKEDHSIELAQLRREKTEIEKERDDSKALLVGFKEKSTLNEIKESIRPFIAKLIIDDPKAQEDALNQVIQQMTLTEGGKVLTKDSLGEQSFMPPEDYITGVFLKDRSYLAKTENSDKVNSKDRFEYNKENTKTTNAQIKEELENAPSIDDLMKETWPGDK
ncbi:hypothetical protein DRO61_05470 [Candidatus Bathyarchaeota archaeon]|nr:MAG: hypothetical protein DRO61_05470 [Candidatus Bathyarchaeota archaeon]